MLQQILMEKGYLENKKFYILLNFLLISMLLLIMVSNCYLKKRGSKQEYLLPYYQSSK